MGNEYIERRALLNDISESVFFSVREGYPSLEVRGAKKIINRINAAPAEDVEKPVRCKECIEWGGVASGNVCKRWSSPLGNLKNCTSADDFCSFGIRKEGA